MNKLKHTIMLSVAAACVCGAFAADAVRKPLFEDGRFEFGVNYWASETATRMWRDWRPESIEKDLAVLEAHGVTVLRVFPTWSDFQPIVEIHRAGPDYGNRRETRFTHDELPLPDTPAGRSGVDEKMLGRFAEFCDMAERHGMKLIVAILTGHMTFRLFIPPAIENRNPQSDPVALYWEAKYIDCFVRTMKDKKAIVAWESGNEPTWFGKLESPSHAAAWLRYIHNQIRVSDPTRPVIGSHGAVYVSTNTWIPWIIDDVAEVSDWLPNHLYELWSRKSPDAIDTIRSAMFLPSRCGVLESISGKPTFVEEHGVRRAEIASPAAVARFLRGEMWNSWAANLRSIVWWCAFDQDNQTCAPYDWSEPCLELGIFKSDRAPYPAAGVAAAFARFAASQPALPKPKSDAVFIVSDESTVHASYILARQAGIMPEYQSSAQKPRNASAYFFPNVEQRGHMPNSIWIDLKDKVRDGATLYLSIDENCFLTGMDSFCGMQIAKKTSESRNLNVNFGDFSLSVNRKDNPVYESCGAEVLAKDQDGNPVFFRNRYGKGSVYTLCFPIERIAHGASGGFDSDAYRIYRKVLSVPQFVEDGARDVTTSFHYVSSSTVLVPVVNNSPNPYNGQPVVADGWRVTGAATDAPEHASFKDGELSLDANCGILLTVEASGKNLR